MPTTKNKGIKEDEDLQNVKEVSFPDCPVRIVESEDKDGNKTGSLEITLISEGWSKNGFYYSKENVEQVAQLAKERTKMYIDHSDPWSGGPSRSLKDWAATVVETWTKDGKAIAKAEMTSNPDTQWIYEEAKKNPDNVGASIDAMVKIKEYEPEEGEELTTEQRQNRRYIVEEVVFLNSTDFVTYASAGGVVNQVLASLKTGTSSGPLDKFTTVLHKLDAHLEHLNNNNTNQTNRKESDMADENKNKPTLTLESLKSDYPNVFEQVKNEVSKAVEAEHQTATEAEKEINDLKAQVNTLESEKKTLETEKGELQVKVDEYETKEAVAAKRARVDKIIKEAELSDEYVSDIFKQDLMKLEKDEDIKARVEERVNLVSGTESVVQGNGERKTKTKESEQVTVSDDDLVNSIKG